MSENHYDELGVDADASRDELRTAYRDRVSDLEARREGKGVNEAQLEANREEMARVRSAWNVLSDPFQRQRYDASLSDPDAGEGTEVELVDDAADSGTQLTGWRRLLAPAPPRPASSGGDQADNRRTPPPPRRPGPEPTVTLPPGMRLAENRSRGMALLFDFAIVLIIATVCQYIIPGLVQSDYRDNVDKMGVLRDLKTAQTDVNDANAAIKDAERAASRAQASGTTQDARAAQADRRAAIEDKQTAQRDINKILRDANNDDVKLGNSVTQSVREAPNTTGDIANAPAFYSVDALERKADAVSDDIAPATWIAFGTAGVLALLYLVPMTARSGHTLGMRGRGIKVVRVDGSPVTWGAAFIRFFVPVALAVALFPVLSTLGFFAALGLVLWGYRDRNRQGVHDKMARTLVVDA